MAELDGKLRIGVHLGDVTIDGNDIYGDGVNVASRIESMSVPGAVLVSDKVFDEIKKFASNGPSEEELDKAKEKMLRERETSEKENNF